MVRQAHHEEWNTNLILSLWKDEVTPRPQGVAGIQLMESAAAFSLTWAGSPDSGMAITFPLRITQASATAVAATPCWAPSCSSVLSPTKERLSPPSGEYAMIGILCATHQGRISGSG